MCPYNFDCLWLEVPDVVIQLVNEFFVNDVPELKHGGKLHPVLFISVARLVGSNNKAVINVTTGNIIVIKVMTAA